MSHTRNIIDTDSKFSINAVTRAITTRSEKLSIVQYDHDSERFTFQMNRYVEEHDMTECDRVEIHFSNVSKTKKDQRDGVYVVEDLDRGNDLDTIFFSWLVSRNATQLVGSLRFSITFICLDDDGNVIYEWGTNIFENIQVIAKLDNTDTVVASEPDLVNHIIQEVLDQIPASGGEVDPAEIERIVQEYLTANPPSGGVDAAEVERIVQEYLEANPPSGGEVEISQVTPEQVVFPDGVYTTYPVGKVELVNGMGTLVEPGGTLKDYFDNFVDEKNPTTTKPSVTVTSSQAKAYEVGTKVTVNYSSTFNPGVYSYDNNTGVTVSSWSITDSNGNTSTEPSGSFPEFTVGTDTNYRVTATANHTDGIVPKTNAGNEYAAGQIKAGSVSGSTTVPISGYRNSFYGTLTEKNELTSNDIRGLTKSNKALSNGNSFTVTIPVGALRVAIAYPATLRDLTSVKDVNGMNADITSSFTYQTLDVEGVNSYEAISYKVYVLDFANANGTANKFTVTI